VRDPGRWLWGRKGTPRRRRWQRATAPGARSGLRAPRRV